VNGIESGVYKYCSERNCLRLLRRADARILEQELVAMLIGQSYAKGSAAAILFSLDLNCVVSTTSPCSALRTCLVRVGAYAQRLVLLAEACDIRTFISASILHEIARESTLREVGGLVVPVHQVVFGVAG